MRQNPNDIFKDNSFEFEFSIRRKDDDTGLWTPVSGLADFSAWISATDDGPEINAAVKVLTVERPLKPGTYFGIVSGAAITAYVFPTVDGTQFYVVGENAGGDIATSSPRKAWNARRI